MENSPPVVAPVRGRGAKSNATGRYEALTRHGFDDGWNELDDGSLPQLNTELQAEKARRIITHNDSPDIGFNSSINPYRGCEHGCIYCPVAQLELQADRAAERLLGRTNLYSS